MEDWQQKCIQDNLSDLTEHIKCSPLFVAELLSKAALSKENQAALYAEKNELKQAEYLLIVIKTKTNGYKELLNALHKTNQSGARDILMLGLLCNLKIQIFDRHSLLKDYSKENEIKEFYRAVCKSDLYKLYTCLATFLENGQPIQLLKETIPRQLPYYISRTLCKRLCLNPEIFKQTYVDIFVVSRVDGTTLTSLAGKNEVAYSSDQLDEITAQIMILEDDGDWDELQVNSLSSPIHLVEYEAEQNKFILKESKGISSIVFRFIDNAKGESDVTIKEEEFMGDIDKEKCHGVCICDLPGMGKTLLIENLARRAKKHNESIVAFIRLQQFTQTILECSGKETPKDIVLQYVSPKGNALSVPVMRKIMELKQVKMDVFFDGFDEIGETNLEMTKTFLKSFISENNIRVFVTSRPHMRMELQNTLGVIAYDILPFDQSNQIDFFAKFWLEKNPNNYFKLKEFAKICRKELNAYISKDEHDIAGKPLLCRLIAEIYAKHATRYVRKNDHLNENWSALGKSMSDIYQTFIDTKFEFEIKNESDRSFSDVERIRQEHYWKALIQLYPDFVKMSTGNVFTADEHMNNHLLSYGLLHEIHNGENITHEFLHRTIAEFFVAEYTARQLRIIYGDSLLDLISNDRTKTRRRQINDFVTFVFQHLLTTQKVDHTTGISVCLTEGYMAHTYYFIFSASTALYFLEHQLKNTKLPKKIHNTGSQTMNLPMEEINLAELIESRGYQNLVSVFCFIESMVLLSPHVEIISKESLCRTLSVIFHFSNLEFVKSCVDFVGKYFSFTQNEIVEVCIKNHWLTPLQYACYRRSFDLLDYLLKNSCPTENQCLVHFIVGSFAKDDRNTQKRFHMIERLMGVKPELLFEKGKQNSIPRLHTCNHMELMKFLIGKGSDIFATNIYGNNLARMLANSLPRPCSDDFRKLVMFLMEECKAIDLFKMKDHEGNTLIYNALFYSQNICSDTLDVLLSKTEININDQNIEGNNLLFAAVHGQQSLETINLLMQLGADYKVINRSGETLLHVAARAGNLNTVKLFSTLGLNRNILSNIGESPSECAYCYSCRNKDCDHGKIITFLKNQKSP